MFEFGSTGTEEVDHLFICKGWHLLNDMYPFFQALDRSNKYYFSDTGAPGTQSMLDFEKFESKRKKAILYFSSSYLEPVLDKLLKIYDEIRFVRLFHGIAGPWAKFIQSPCPLVDVVVAASELDAGFVRSHSNYRVEIIGWPKGENFYRASRLEPTVVKTNSVLIASNWTEKRGDLRICDYINGWNELDRTFMVHPLLPVNRGNDRAVEAKYRDFQLSKIDPSLVKVVQCQRGVLNHMKDKALLVGVISSSSFEWLLFDRPIVFLKGNEYLDFGPLLDYGSDINKQIMRAIDGPDYFSDLRWEYRGKLMSHFDGKYSVRFNALIEDLERHFSPVHTYYSFPSPTYCHFATLDVQKTV